MLRLALVIFTLSFGTCNSHSVLSRIKNGARCRRFDAYLDSRQEVPPLNPDVEGTCESLLRLSYERNELFYKIHHCENLTGGPIEAHIHEGEIGQIGNKLVTLNLKRKEGVIAENIIEASVIGDNEFEKLIALIFEGKAYINIQTEKYVTGEIRGQIMYPSDCLEEEVTTITPDELTSTEAPTTESPATEALVTEAPATEAPATETPATEATTTEVPATEAPATEVPATETPTTETTVTEVPVTETPETETPTTEAPTTEAPETEAPATEAPATEAPATEAPATEAPATEAPATEAPATEAPATEAPATEAPATEAPATEAPATDTPVPNELGKEHCFLPPDAGLCEAIIKRFYFNPDTNRCETFNYGGCDGNYNNFKYSYDCFSSCGGEFVPQEESEELEEEEPEG